MIFSCIHFYTHYNSSLLMILILTGPVRSYKTTTLMKWSASRADCGGVLTPDVDGSRCVMDIFSKKIIPFQIPEQKSVDDILIGRFVFSSAAFNEAKLWLDQQISDPDIKYLILDEVGPLELKDLGWHDWLKAALEKFGDKTLIIVVREALLSAVVEKYNLREAKIVDKSYFQ